MEKRVDKVGGGYYNRAVRLAKDTRQPQKEDERKMSEKEIDARRMVEQLKKLPEEVQERVGYIIEGAALVHGAADKQGEMNPEEKGPAA